MAQDLPVVRLAEPPDEPEILAMCERLWKENGMFSLKLSKVQALLQRCFRREGVIVGVIGPTGGIEASTCLSLSDYFYSDDWHLAEHWNFVDEQFRKSRNAESLIEFGKDCVRKMGCPLVTGIITNKQMAGKVRLYRRLLGAPAGAFFVYNAPQWKSEPIEEDHTDLVDRMRKYAVFCNELKRGDWRRGIEVVKNEIAPALREGAKALRGEDSIWGAGKRKNGSHDPTVEG